MKPCTLWVVQKCSSSISSIEKFASVAGRETGYSFTNVETGLDAAEVGFGEASIDWIVGPGRLRGCV